MKFMVTWRVYDDQRHDALEAFSGMSDEDVAGEFAGLKLIGRWHDLIGFTGVAIVETDDPNAISAWALSWNKMIDIESVPVLDDKEARKLGRKVLG